jgi:DNA (cytosine-5)-methyltransferase 1
MTKIDREKYRGTVDLIVGGTPCQDFSIAGKRAGMAGERGKLALAFVDLVRAVSPRWIVWENVPGVLSSGYGNDFADFLLAFRQCGYHVGYRVLDAQYFRVPQKRRRVFLVGYFGDWRPAATVLFDPSCLRRGTLPSRQKKTEIAGTLEGCAGGRGANSAGVNINGFLQVTQALTGSLGSGGADDNRAQGGFYVPEIVAQALSCKWSKRTSGPAGDEHQFLVTP